MAKRRYWIDVEDTKALFRAYALDLKEINWYHIRITNEEAKDVFWDWYHTQGSVVEVRNSIPKSLGKWGDREDLAIEISDRVYKSLTN